MTIKLMLEFVVLLGALFMGARAGGVGLGLALVKSIAERHGGSVACEGGEGGGACFRVRLPGALG